MRLLLLLIPLLATLALLPANQGLWWDEAVYLGLAKGLSEGRYSLDPAFPAEAFRPPVFPLLLMPFRDPLLARAAALATALLALAATALLARRVAPRSGLWAAALLATAAPFVFFASKALSEPLFIALAALSAWAFRPREARWLLIAGLLASLAALTRYFGLLLILAQALLLLRWRSWRSLAPLLAGAALPLLLWTLATAPIYGPLGAIGENFKIYAGATNPDIAATGLEALGLVGLLALGGLALLAKRSEHRTANPAASLAALVAILALASFLLLPNKEPRYLLSFLGFFAVLAALPADLLSARAAARPGALRSVALAALLLLMALSALVGLSQQWQDRSAATALVEASRFVALRTGPEDLVLTSSPPYLAAAHRRGLSLCGPQGTAHNRTAADAYAACSRALLAGSWDPATLAPLAARFGARWLVLYAFEPTTPRYLPAYLEDEGAQRIASFEQWGDPEAVVVYDLAPLSGG